MHIHILGICGTFMGGLGLIASQQGHRVTGSDANVYPPMSCLLQDHGITLMEGYHPSHMKPEPDLVIIGNALSRGNPAVEYVLDRNLPYISGPQWLSENVLQERWVLAVAGTHGKTTTTAMLAWIFESAGFNPGYLIGGAPHNFDHTARLGGSPFFIIEADEYDTAFFDKRSKFIHYRPRTLVLNNLEFDHADIFSNLDAIKTQFQHLVRTVPSNGLIINNAFDENLADVLDKGCWTPGELVSLQHGNWCARNVAPDGHYFDVVCEGETVGRVDWTQVGLHNVHNGLAALAAARHGGIPPHVAIDALNTFEGVKRRMECRGDINGVKVYDDFAHHPTAIEATLHGLRKKVGVDRIIAVVEFGSNTMARGDHGDKMLKAFDYADEIFFARPAQMGWGVDDLASKLIKPTNVCDDVSTIVDELSRMAKPNDHIVIMSNKGFGGIHEKLLKSLNENLEVAIQ